MKAVLISIQPKWCEKIASGEKTIEVRKTVPSLERPFKCYIYCTKTVRDKKVFFAEETFDGKKGKWAIPHVGNGKVIGEFVCDRVDGYLCEKYEWDDGDVSLEYRIRTVEGQKTCFEYDEIREYGNEKTLYFWHISNLKIYDKPKALSEFRKPCPYTDGSYCLEDKCEHYCNYNGNCYFRVEIPPQSWCYVEVQE